MDIYRPLGAGLFFYECLRILLLVVFLVIAPPGSGFSVDSGFQDSNAGGAFFPYIVYLSSSALFPIMTLFIWLKREEYRNYLPLYMAGKIIAVVLFYFWAFFTNREFPGMENIAKSIILWFGSIFLSLADILSLLGAWKIYSKFRKALVPEGGGV